MDTGFLRRIADAPIPKIGLIVLALAFVVAGGGVWTVPAILSGSFGFLAKLLTSIIFIVTGVGLLQAGSDAKLNELRFDAARKEVFLVRPTRYGRRPRVINSFSYSDIHDVSISDTELEMLGAHGHVLTSIRLDGPDARMDAMAQIRSHLPAFA